ncbi:MAG: ATP-dependent nuclease, partial [Pseudanabaena sp.]
ILKIEADVALPSSVPIRKLIEIAQENSSVSQQFELLDQKQRNKIIDAIDVFRDNSNLITKVRSSFGGKDHEEISPEAVDSLKSIISAVDENSISEKDRELRDKEFALAYKLVCKIAQVDANALLELAEAIKSEMEGYANGIIEKINRQLSTNFNFSNYWVQDRNFFLKVMARSYDLVFTISDRTGTEYSFDERSQGLRYFLSYYIQYRSHSPNPNKDEILLMDEPDAYLSSQAQQDLLKVFNLFANPQSGSHLLKPIQVIYVTHSPFLIDKNHAERIRVLQKGNEDEGTRIVKDVARNHYEPLRSSIGAYVGETTFIGNCNLMVEGLSDQILIAGATTYLRSKNYANLETLDLNQITIVPSGSASHIPYLVYLASGRDAEKPAIIVLLDSDKSGNDAKKHLLGKGGQHRRPIINEKFVLQINDLRNELNITGSVLHLEIEDFIPLPICIQAIRFYLQEFLQINEKELSFLTEELILEKQSHLTIIEVIKSVLSDYFENELKINKIGFARNVIRVVNEWSRKKEQDLSESQIESLQTFAHNFKVLFVRLNSMQRHAQMKLTNEKMTQKIDRIKKDFNARYPISAKREDGIILLEHIENILENSKDDDFKEIESIKAEINNLRYIHKLNIDMDKIIDDYNGFKIGLERIKYAGLFLSQEENTELLLDDVIEQKTIEIKINSDGSSKVKNLEDEFSSSQSQAIDNLLQTSYPKITNPKLI